MTKQNTTAVENEMLILDIYAVNHNNTYKFNDTNK